MRTTQKTGAILALGFLLATPLQSQGAPGHTPGPAKETRNPAQQAFWDYLENFNRLPENPTDLQRRIFATQGKSKTFLIISTSPTSIMGNASGIKAYQPTFVARYPWVKTLLEKEGVTLEVDETVFQGQPMEVVKKHGQKLSANADAYFVPLLNRRVFIKRWLECLMAIDYIFAHGNKDDHKYGMYLVEQTVLATVMGASQRDERGDELEVPAVCDIIIPIANRFPENVSEKLVKYTPYLITGDKNAPAHVDALKWMLEVKEFAKWEKLAENRRLEIGNQYVKHGLTHYAVYWHHLGKNTRPNPKSTGVAIKALFHRIFDSADYGNWVEAEWSEGKANGKAEHQKYLALLDAAYPLQNP